VRAIDSVLALYEHMEDWQTDDTITAGDVRKAAVEIEKVLERLRDLHSVRTKDNCCEYCSRVFPCDEYKEIKEALGEE
jgi:hypothetical protein